MKKYNINIGMKDLVDYLAIKDLDIEHWRIGYEKLYNRIDKAIEYIEEYQEVLKEHNGDWLNYQDGFKPYLLDILQGEDKDE